MPQDNTGSKIRNKRLNAGEQAIALLEELEKYDDVECSCALLSVAYQRRMSVHELRKMQGAARDLQNSDRALAIIRLTHQGCLPIPELESLASRLSLARYYLLEGTAPAIIIDAVEAWARSLAKYDADQPRIPAGSGKESGRWLSQNALRSAQAAIAIAVDEGVFAAGLSPQALSGLASLAGVVGFGAVLGTMFVPLQNTSTNEGTLPGEPSTKFIHDRAQGSLRLLDANTGATIAFGHQNSLGLVRDAETGLPFARVVAGALVFDQAAMSAVDRDETDVAPLALPNLTAARRKNRSSAPILVQMLRTVRPTDPNDTRLKSAPSTIRIARFPTGGPSACRVSSPSAACTTMIVGKTMEQ